MKNNNKFKIDFIGIGAAKCATTWVYRRLLEHPQICGPYIKEISFFLTRKYPLYSQKYFENKKILANDGIKSYLSYFSHCKPDSIKGEFSVSYITDPKSAELIKHYFPDVKIIVCLRNPVKRAFSLYNYARDFIKKEKNETFEKALENNPDIYIDGGMYYQQLKRYFNLFPKKNIGIFLIDDIKKDPKLFMQDIFRFLEVSDEFSPPSLYERENEAKRVKFNFLRNLTDGSVEMMYQMSRVLKIGFLPGYLRKLGFQDIVNYINKINSKKIQKSFILPETEKKLRKIFREDIENLEKLINRDLKNWK